MSVSIQRQEGSLTSDAKRILTVVCTGDFVSVETELWTTVVQSGDGVDCQGNLVLPHLLVLRRITNQSDV